VCFDDVAAEHWVLELDEVAAVGELRIAQQVLHVRYRCRVEASGLQLRRERLGLLRLRPLGEVLLERIELALPAVDRGQPRRRRPGGRAQDPTQAPPVLVIVDGDRHPAILAGAREYAVRRRVWRAIPDAAERLSARPISEEPLAESVDAA